MTGLHDAAVSSTLTPLMAHYGFAANVLSAREFRMLEPDDNLILLGHKKGNPWVEMFEERMNFRFVFDYAAHVGRIENRSPKAGEQPSYSVEYGKQGYCVIAYLPKPIGKGAALVAFGTDMASLGALGHLLSDEKSMAGLLGRVGAGSGPLRYFEALARTQLMMNLAPKTELIAVR
jgi:hypothetical protein